MLQLSRMSLYLLLRSRKMENLLSATVLGSGLLAALSSAVEGDDHLSGLPWHFLIYCTLTPIASDTFLSRVKNMPQQRT